MMKMSFEERISRLKQRHISKYGSKEDELCVVFAPYRICPIGAHVDHQLGIVTGMTLENGIILVFTKNDTGTINLSSLNFPEDKFFRLNGRPERAHDWSDYARGAISALSGRFKINNGINAVLEGDLPIGGLSSSAAVGVSYLLAIEKANDISVLPEDNIKLHLMIENDFINLNVGILDQSVILLSKKDCLLYLNCMYYDNETYDYGKSSSSFEVIVAYSGVRKKLVDTDYNKRVFECERAASILIDKSCRRTPGAKKPKLGYIENSDFEEYKGHLSQPYRKRAEHFFSECERVNKGLKYWANGEIEEFGKLMQESGQSSIVNYECGCPELISLTEILNETDGVYGARFSGAGFRGSCIGLSSPEKREQIKERVEREYSKKHPGYKDSFEIHFCGIDSGARIL